MESPKNLQDYQIEAIAEGFFYECDCGEIHNSPRASWECRKCRTYLMDEDFWSRRVIDLRSGEAVPRGL